MMAHVTVLSLLYQGLLVLLGNRVARAPARAALGPQRGHAPGGPGAHRLRHPAGCGPSVMPALELKVPPLALTAITLVLIAAAGLVAPMASLAFAGHAAAAAIVAGAGLAVMLGCGVQFRLRRTTLDPRAPGKARRTSSPPACIASAATRCTWAWR